MLNYIESAEAGWKALSGPIRYLLGNKFQFNVLFVNGSLVDISITYENEDADAKSLLRSKPLTFTDQIKLANGQHDHLPVVLEDFLTNLYFSLMEDWDLKVHRLVMNSQTHNHAFVVSLIDHDEEIILMTSSKMFFNLM